MELAIWEAFRRTPYAAVAAWNGKKARRNRGVACPKGRAIGWYPRLSSIPPQAVPSPQIDRSYCPAKVAFYRHNMGYGATRLRTSQAQVGTSHLNCKAQAERRSAYEDNVNLYGYVGNDPVNQVDPLGKQSARAMDNKLGNNRGAEALRYECTGTCVQVAQTFANVARTIADFIPIVGDIKSGAEFVENPTLVGSLAFVVGVVPGLGGLAGKGLKGLDSPAARRAGEGVRDFLGKGDPRVIPRPEGNLTVVSADGQRQLRMEFTEKGNEIQPHAGLQQRNNRGDWEDVADEHIYFEGDK